MIEKHCMEILQHNGLYKIVHYCLMYSVYIEKNHTGHIHNFECVLKGRRQYVHTVRGRSQLSTFMKAYTAYARGEGVWDHRTLFLRKSTFIFNHGQCIIK